jgi:cold shock CspA family protein/ribosome-associated translation inhibitor RaiA
MELQIQTRQIDLDPDWRDLTERLAERLAARYPEMLRLRVTVSHPPHHRRGLEEVALVANVEGVTLRAAKQEEHVRTAVHAAFDALTLELERHHRERRRVTKSPGVRLGGSIKRIFRDAGYGFIHHLPGRDVYFSRAALHELRFEDLRPGTPVEYEIEQGANGPQASRVFPVGERARA